jgi:hypothetical protein
MTFFEPYRTDRPAIYRRLLEAFRRSIGRRKRLLRLGSLHKATTGDIKDSEPGLGADGVSGKLCSIAVRRLRRIVAKFRRGS